MTFHLVKTDVKMLQHVHLVDLLWNSTNTGNYKHTDADIVITTTIGSKDILIKTLVQ